MQSTMGHLQEQAGFIMDQNIWEIAEGLYSHDPNIREISLDRLSGVDGFFESPLIAALLVHRLSEPDLDICFHVVQLLGSLVDQDSSGQRFSDQGLVYAQVALDQIGKSLVVKLLEVSEKYLSSAKPICAILHMISYAGNSLSGIVNDRNQPVVLRQQAIFYCGEVGFLSTTPALESLIQRIEKARSRPDDASPRKKNQAEEQLYPYAISALEKLKI